MRKDNFNITVSHLFIPISAFSAESKSYIITLHFKFHETLQTNQSKWLVFNNTFVRERRLLKNIEQKGCKLLYFLIIGMGQFYS